MTYLLLPGVLGKLRTNVVGTALRNNSDTSARANMSLSSASDVKNAAAIERVYWKVDEALAR
jgi:hypothetical protein